MPFPPQILSQGNLRVQSSQDPLSKAWKHWECQAVVSACIIKDTEFGKSNDDRTVAHFDISFTKETHRLNIWDSMFNLAGRAIPWTAGDRKLLRLLSTSYKASKLSLEESID